MWSKSVCGFPSVPVLVLTFIAASRSNACLRVHIFTLIIPKIVQRVLGGVVNGCPLLPQDIDVCVMEW